MRKIIILLLLSLLPLTACSQVQETDNAQDGPVKKEERTVPAEDSGDETPEVPETKKPEDDTGEENEKLTADVRLLTEGVPDIFQIGASDDSISLRSDCIVLKTQHMGDKPYFWLINPFYEPKKFLLADILKEGSNTVYLSELLEGLSPRKLPVTVFDRGYRVGPYPHCGLPNCGELGENSYSWANPRALMLSKWSDFLGLIDLKNRKSMSSRELNIIGRSHNIAVSPDNTKIAFIRKGYFVVRELGSGKEQRWPLTEYPDATTGLGLEPLSWSPNGRYILGSWYPEGHSYRVAKLWVLDLEKGKIIDIKDERHHPFGSPTWSPDGNQVVLYESFVSYTEGYDDRWILVELPEGETRVVVPRSTERIDYRFRWDEEGNVKAFLPGNEEVRVKSYCTRFETYQEDLVGDMRFVATELHFFNREGKELFRINLEPALKKAGVIPEELNRLTINPYWSPDGKYLYLNCRAIKASALPFTGQEYMLHGIVRMEERTAYFLSPEETDDHRHFPRVIKNRYWSGHRVLLPGAANNRSLRVLDAERMEVTTLLEGQKFLTAFWSGEDVFYVSSGEVGLIGEGEPVIIERAPEGEQYAPVIKVSPAGKFIAVPRKKSAGDFYWVTIDIFTLDSMGQNRSNLTE